MKPSAQEKKWIAAIKKSGRFDRKFYRRWYGDDPEVGWALERHYILKGELKGFWPCLDFCPEVYLITNSDVAEAGVSPFYHYVTSGQQEGRLLLPPSLSSELLDGDRGGQVILIANSDVAEAGDSPFCQFVISGQQEGRLLRPPYLPSELFDEDSGGQSIDAFDRPEPKARFAIVVQVFHYEMWPGIADQIDSLAGDFDIFVTIAKRPDDDFEGLSATIKKAYPNASVYLHPNHGRDIYPFFRIVNSGLLSSYEAVCKIHTKKSPHLETGKAWSDHLVRSLLPKSGKSRELLECFLSADRCGVLTADGQKKSGLEWWHMNRGRTLNLLARVGIHADPKQLCFPVGSMYWLKPRIVEALKRLQLSAEDFEPEQGQGDGTTAHAMERVFGYLADSEDLKVMEIGELIGQSVSTDDLKSYDFCEPDELHAGARPELEIQSLRKKRLPPVSRFVRYRGMLECCSSRGVVGWIQEMSDRKSACRIRLSIDGLMVTEAFADHYRSDLGGRDELVAYCGFVLPLADQFFDGEVHSFQIAVIGDAWSYQSLCYRTRLARKEDMGEVQEISKNAVIGKCCDPFDPEFKQEVDLMIDGYFAGGTEPSDESDGGHEFRLVIPPSFQDGEKHDLKVVVRGSRICLWSGTEYL